MMKQLLAATLCMFVVAACAMGGAKRSAAPQTMQAPSTAGGGAPSPKQELDDLYAKLEQQRESMQLPEPQIDMASPAMPMSAEAMPKSTDASCKHSQSETCTNSCTLSDSICDNAGKICRLADELKPDDDAATKCTKATKTCKASNEKCCSCM